MHRNRRTRDQPQTPDIHRQYSKRQWDGLVRKWRRQLHQWDVLGPNGEPIGDSNETPNDVAASSSAVASARELSDLDKEIEAVAMSLPEPAEDVEIDEDDLAALDEQLAEFI
jgi:hypothetical protein